MTNRKIILVAYDFTEEAACALNHAIGIAALNNGLVYINHIVDKKSLAHAKHEHKSVFDLKTDLETIARENTSDKVEVQAIINEGDIFHDIPKTAIEHNAELIVFGTHGVKGMQHLLGAFAMKLVSSATVPVIIVQRRNIRSSGYKKIVYPVDENPYSKQKAYAVSSFAKEQGAEILVFPKKNSDEHFQAYTDGNLRYSVKVFEESGVPFSVFENTKSSAYGKLVVDFAARNDADLIAITTQDSDDHDLGDVFLGSEDVRIVNNEAEIPTLCINATVSLKVGGLSGVTGT